MADYSHMHRAATAIGLTIVMGLLFGLTHPRMGHSRQSLRWRARLRPMPAQNDSDTPSQAKLPGAAGRLYHDTLSAWVKLIPGARSYSGLLVAFHAATGGLLAGLVALAAIRILREPPWLIVVATLVTMGSFGLWRASTDIGPAIMAICGCMAAFCLMLVDIEEPMGLRLAVAGAFWAMAAAVHGMAFWFLPVLVVFVLVSRPTVRPRRRRLGGLAVGAVLAVVGLYFYETKVGADVTGQLGFGGWLVRRLDLRQVPAVSDIGRSALGLGRSIVHGGLLWERIRPGSPVAPFTKFVLLVPVALVLGFMLRLAAAVPHAVRSAGRQDGRLAAVLVAWVVSAGAYAIVSDPSAPASWTMALVPGWLLMAFPLRRRKMSLQSGDGNRLLLGACGLLLVTVNVVYDILPRQRTKWAGDILPGGALQAAVEPEDTIVVTPEEAALVVPWVDDNSVAVLPVDGDQRATVDFLLRCREVLDGRGRLIYSQRASKAEGDAGRLLVALRREAVPLDVVLPDPRRDGPWSPMPVTRRRFYVVE